MSQPIPPGNPSRSLPYRVVARSWRFIRKRVRKWHERHQHPFNLAIHFVGIPLALYGLYLLFFSEDPWYWGAGALLLGYTLQFLGHLVEGNDMGEWAAVKRFLGLPCVVVSPRWQQPGPVEMK